MAAGISAAPMSEHEKESPQAKDPEAGDARSEAAAVCNSSTVCAARRSDGSVTNESETVQRSATLGSPPWDSRPSTESKRSSVVDVEFPTSDLPAFAFGFEPDFMSKYQNSGCELLLRPQVRLSKRVSVVDEGTLLYCNQMANGFLYATDPKTGMRVSFRKDSCTFVEQMTIKDPYEITHSGALKKCGGAIQTWHWRWFDLRKSQLAYFKARDDRKPIKTIKLIDVEITRLGVTRFNMKTSDGDRVWQFESRSKQEADQWVRNLNMASFRGKSK